VILSTKNSEIFPETDANNEITTIEKLTKENG